MQKLDNKTVEELNKSLEIKRRVKLAVRVIIISALLILLVVGYTFMFSSGLARGGPFGTKVVGVMDDSSFYDAKNGDLIFITPTANISSIQEDDIVVYHINGDVGSYRVKSVDALAETVTVYDGESTKLLAFELIIGKQGTKIAFIGYICGFIVSRIGVLCNSLLLFAYVVYITFSRINEEYTVKGKELRDKYIKLQKSKKQKEKMIKRFKKTDGFGPEDSVIIDGDMGDNMIELVSYTKSGKVNSVSETYKYILGKVHRVYMYKDKLTRNEKKRITNVIEMCPIVDSFGEGTRYKLVDLLLLNVLSEFDTVGFEKLAVKFLNSKISEEDLYNFGSVLYVLVDKNPKLIHTNIIKVVKLVIIKTSQFEKTKQMLEMRNLLFKFVKNQKTKEEN